MAYSFLNSEKGSNFQWVLQRVKDVIDERYYPRVIVTDRDLALIGACRAEFPNANRLICRWHISQNILQYCRNRCGSLKEYESIKWTWEWMVKSPTRRMYEQYYEHLQELLVNHADIARYLNNWLRDYSDNFICFITDQYRSFGQTTTCRVESQHALLKLYLGSTQSNLDTLLSSIDKILISQETAIKDSFNRSINEKINNCNISLFAELLYKVSKYAFKLMFKELLLSIAAEDCSHQLRSVYGLPCFHEMRYYVIHERPIPLDAIDIFWKTLSVPWPTINRPLPEDGRSPESEDDISFENDMQEFKSVFTKAPSLVRKNIINKLRGIYKPESVDTRQPVVQKNTRGRPSAKDKNSKATKVPDLNEVPTVDHRRSTTSRSTKVPNFNKEHARHSSYTGPSVQQRIRHQLYVGDVESEYFMEQTPERWHPYIISIYNVVGDGNCGFRCVAHGICEDQNRWRDVREMLLQELALHREVYTNMWLQAGFNGIWYSVNWFGNGAAPLDRNMIMSDTGLVIASLINRPVVFISLRGWNTCFPLFFGPNFSQRTDPLVIARVGSDECGHYICLTLDGDSPLHHLHPQWRRNRTQDASQWETLYYDRLNKSL